MGIDKEFRKVFGKNWDDVFGDDFLKNAFNGFGVTTKTPMATDVPPGKYAMRIDCANCGKTFRYFIPKGTHYMAITEGEACKNCGCRTLVKPQ